MKRFFGMLVFATAAMTLPGCASQTAINGIATPWAALAVHSFHPVDGFAEPSEREVNAEVALLLRETEGASDDVRVAAR